LALEVTVILTSPRRHSLAAKYVNDNPANGVALAAQRRPKWVSRRPSRACEWDRRRRPAL